MDTSNAIEGINPEALIAEVEERRAARFQDKIKNALSSVMSEKAALTRVGEVAGMQEQLAKVLEGIEKLENCGGNEDDEEMNSKITDGIDKLGAEKRRVEGQLRPTRGEEERRVAQLKGMNDDGLLSPKLVGEPDLFKEVDCRDEGPDLYPQTVIEGLSYELRAGMGKAVDYWNRRLGYLIGGWRRFVNNKSDIMTDFDTTGELKNAADELMKHFDRENVIKKGLDEVLQTSVLKEGELAWFEELLNEMAKVGAKFDTLTKEGWKTFLSDDKIFYNALIGIMDLKTHFVDKYTWDRVKQSSMGDLTSVTRAFRSWKEKSNGFNEYAGLKKLASKEIPWYYFGLGKAMKEKRSALEKLEVFKRPEVQLRRGCSSGPEAMERAYAAMAEAWRLMVDNHARLCEFIDPDNRQKLYAAKRYMVLRDLLNASLEAANAKKDEKTPETMSVSSEEATSG